MQLQSLLLSQDAELERILRHTLEKLSVDVDVCRAVAAGREILATERFDAVIVDCDDLPEGMEILRDLRQGRSNRTSVTFALLNGATTTHQAFALGVNFVLQKPVSTINAIRCFSAGLGLMIRERRRYFRHSIDATVTLILDGGKEFLAKATNLSEGGMAVSSEEPLPRSRTMKIVFTLPGTLVPFAASVDLAWVGGKQAGLRFGQMPHSSREQLDQWLSEQMEQVEQGLK
jgi:CheY-like chemotaxis protein